MIAVHHYICGFMWWEVWPAKKNACVGVHGCLVGRHGAVELPDDDTLGVIQEVVAYTWDVFDEWDIQFLKLDAWADT